MQFVDHEQTNLISYSSEVYYREMFRALFHVATDKYRSSLNSLMHMDGLALYSEMCAYKCTLHNLRV